ncbi:MAG: zinc-dependent metalloprotease [Nocardioidaceae bacterium]
MAESGIVDWRFAVQTAARLVRPGPQIPRDEVDDVVDELRRGAALSENHVRDFTELHARSATAPVLVVDRRGWVQANADGFATLMDPLVDKIRRRHHLPDGVVKVVGSRVTGAEAGALLGFLSTKVLGQFDPFWTGGPESTGRMLLVAPNIVAAEQELDVDPHDFRLWVCLHEETHRVQFTAVPWMRDYLRGQVAEFVDATDIDPERLATLLNDAIGHVARIVRGDSDVSIAEILASPEQRQVIDRLTGVMSLLEGHADVVMDGVGPSVIPTVDQIRTRFNRRRGGGSPFDLLIRRLLGLDAKMRQYKDGAAFVRAVVDKVGTAGFNAVWSEPSALPSKAEIADPASWVARLHG